MSAGQPDAECVECGLAGGQSWWCLLELGHSDRCVPRPGTAAGQPDTQQQTDRAQTADPTAAIEIWARLLCAADAHVYGPEHPTWQSLSSDKLRDDYRKAARWLLPRMTVDRCSGAERAAVLREAADLFEERCPEASGGLELCMCHAADELRRMAGEAGR